MKYAFAAGNFFKKIWMVYCVVQFEELQSAMANVLSSFLAKNKNRNKK